jgi:protein SCO1
MNPPAMTRKESLSLRQALIAPLLAATLAVTGCNSAPSGPAEADWPLAGATIGGDFTLVDKDGKTVTWQDFAGQWRIVYFGFTFCPDVCPVDAAAIGGGLNRFEEMDAARAAKVTPIFISVDPKRDTPEVVGEFAAAFHPRMVGLTGTPEQVAAAAKAFVATYSYGEPDETGYYRVDHTAMTLLFDPDGKPVAILETHQGPQVLADELAKWVQ